MKSHLFFRNILTFLLSFFLVSQADSQIVIRVGQHPGTAGSLQGWSPAQSQETPSAASQAPYYVQEIMNTIGLKPNFEVRAARIDNAAAVTYAGKRYILYNPDFIDALVRRTGNKWAAVSVLAHEIGHHLDGHTVTGTGSQPRLELEADEFSGYVLRKMGASLEDAQAGLRAIATETASATHPGRSDRLTSIAAGWNRANGTPANRINTDIAAAPRSYPATAPGVSVQPNENSRTAVLDERFILGDLRFGADPNTPYYVTTRYHVVKVQNNQLVVLGKMARIDNDHFPYVIYDEQQTKLLVQSNGTILNENGRAVGSLKAHRA